MSLVIIIGTVFWGVMNLKRPGWMRALIPIQSEKLWRNIMAKRKDRLSVYLVLIFMIQRPRGVLLSI